MPEEHISAEQQKPDLTLEIAHLLLIDVCGYSKLLVNEQIELLHELNRIVRSTDSFRTAEKSGKLIRVPTGDGMALVFFHSPEEPARCAMEISLALKDSPHIQVRMGVHSGPVNEVTDVNDRSNIAGAGINVAQRVMDCGDAGHILVSKHVADDLASYRHWQPYLHDLGECEVKHGLRLHVVNLYKEDIGNPQVPEKLRRRRKWSQPAHSVVRPVSAPRLPKSLLIISLLLSALVLAISFSILFRRGGLSRGANPAIFGPEKSIAVLPFENLSTDQQNAFFADGVQDEILMDLAKVADLKVISRTSVMQYKSGTERNMREIAQQLGVTHVLEGSVQRTGNRVRVTAQLIDARRDNHVWAERYDRDLADVFAIQSEIAKTIADQLQAKMSPNEKAAIEKAPTADVAAFELYSRAKDLILQIGFPRGTENLRAGIDLLNQALVRDPSFFAAQCQLAFAHDLLYAVLDHTPERRALADAAIEAAFRLRPDAGEAHLTRGYHLYRTYLNYDQALAELEIARRTLPNEPRIFESTGYIARRRGQFEAGLRNLQRAVELDPRNRRTLEQLAGTYQVLRRYPEAIAMYDRTLSIKPDDADTKAARALLLLDWKALTGPVHEAIDEIRAKNPQAIKSVADIWFLCALAERDANAAEAALAALGDGGFGDSSAQFTAGFGRALLARMSKDEEKARSAFAATRADQEKVVQAQPDFGPPMCVLALIDAGLGRKEDALREVRRAVELTPVEKDSLDGADIIQYSAIVAAWFGDKDLALQQLAKATQLPGYLSYGRLKLLPWWDPLRGDPRFGQIVAALAPKE